jgi:acetyl-CoA acetyltransferase
VEETTTAPCESPVNHKEAMPGSVIAGGARTPIGKLSGALKNFQAVDLGGLAIKAPLEKSGISGDQVDYVIMGQVIQARPARTPPGRRRSRMVSR